MKMKLTIFGSILIVLSIADGIASYRILALFPLPTKSHHIMFDALMKGLARKGHQVDLVSTFSVKDANPNYKGIIKLQSTMPRFMNNLTYDMFTMLSNQGVTFFAKGVGNGICKSLENPDLVKLVRNPPTDPPYDLVLMEFLSSNCYMAVGHLLKVPTIGIATCSLYSWLNPIIANPANMAFVSNTFDTTDSPTDFWNRLYTTVLTAAQYISFRYMTSEQDDIIRRTLGDNVPSVREIEKDVALVLLNTHISIHGPRPITSAVVEVGGLHIQDHDEELSPDLEKWMDESENGFVYFTFGSMVTIESFPPEILRIFYKSLAKISPIRVLMKIPDPTKLPPGLPKNIRTFVWAPQFKVLQHKNIKVFVTHGGMMGTQESIYCGVPMLGIPLFVDQFSNIDLYVARKIAVKLDIKKLTEKDMDTALNEILYNPIYKDTISKISSKFRDRPMSPLDTAIWWVEYVGRHGSKALRSPAVDLAWWQIELLDVYAVLLLIMLFIAFLTFYIVRQFIKALLTLTSSKVTLEKKIK